ncbi:Csu type fimbrial protein [Martelella alba]|uniref:Spore coat protein U domain-containing protein n=1 Tax=Martelella alba TaxID=2590451 RepID=A0ABY2SPY8_9HYPH|nr:spore coat U domain-containing protein [Martelella alba]TKI07303.1 spore coat protein U domain-containing protein [Martelella alba]
MKPSASALRHLGAALLICTGQARALPTQTFQVAATIVAGCQVLGSGIMGTLDFGSLASVGGSTADGTFRQNGALTIACTPGTTLSMSIDGGSHYANSRYLLRAGGTDTVAYRLFTHSVSGSASEIPVNQNIAISYADANQITLPIYATAYLNGGQPAGTYTDTLAVTLSW